MLNTKDINRTALDCLPAMRRMFKRMGLKEDRIDDAVQDGYIHLVTKALPKWRGKGSVTVFALQAAKLRFIDTTRTTAYKVSSAREALPSGLEDFGSDYTAHFEDERAALALSRVVELRALNQAIACLGDRERAVAEAYARTGELKATAREVGVSHATACRILNNGVLPRLRELLAD